MALQFGTRFWPKMKDGPPGVGTSITERYFNPIWELIDKRLADLEDLKADWLAAVQQLIDFGLQRIDEVLAPAFSKLGRISELGFLKANSTTAETLVLEETSTFIITDEAQRDLFHPSAWVTITKPTSSSDYALGQVQSYVRETGILDVKIKQIVGSAGPHSDWEIIAGTGVTFYMQSKADSALSSKNAAEAARDIAVAAKNTTQAAAIVIANGPVSSVNGQVGTVVLSPADVGAMSAADGSTLSTNLTNSVNTALAAQTTANATALADKEKLWKSPAAYNSGVALDHQHILATSTFSLDLITTTAAVGARFRITQIGSGFVVTLNGTGVRFRNPAGAWVTEAFIINKPGVTAEFVKVASTDWELL